MHVAVMTAPKSMPVVERTAGCTKMMYDIVMNVVSPASSSVRIVVREAVRWKVFSSRWRIIYYEFCTFLWLDFRQHGIGDFSCTETAADVPRRLTFIHTCHDGILYRLRRFIETEIFEHHGGRENRSHRVRYVLSSKRWR